jgi:hypothetical protein
LQSDLFLEIFEIGFFVERDVSHVPEVSPDLDAAQLDRRLKLQRLELLLQVIATDLSISS